MACNSGNCPPIPKVSFSEIGNFYIFNDDTNYKDNGGHDNNRKGCWIFYLNDVEVYRNPLLYLFESVELGINSTCKTLTLENGLEDLINIFQNIAGVQVQTGDKMGVGRCAQSAACDDVVDSENKVEFIYEGTTTPIYIFPLTPVDETPICPINYNTTVFDLSFVGGNTDETFLTEQELLDRMAFLNPVGSSKYSIDQESCEFMLVITDTVPPVTSGGPTLNPNGAPTYTFPIIDSLGNSVCPIDFDNTTFDLSIFGGATDQLFAGQEGIGLLENGVQTLNPANTAPYVFDETACTLSVQSNTTPSVTTGDIVATVNTTVFTFPLSPTGVCPIDFSTATFDLTFVGGSTAEIFTDEQALLDRMLVLNSNGSGTYSLNATTCELEFTSTVAPPVTTGGPTVDPNGQLTTYAFDLLDGTGVAACPLDYALNQFDLTPFGGTATETFANDAGLLARMQTLNSGDGNVYVIDLVGCSVSIDSSTAPPATTGDIVVSNITVSVDYVIDIIDGTGTPICPVDFGLTTFDLTPFAGTALETFINGAALATRMDVLNAGTGGNWAYETAPECRLLISSTTAPNVVADITATVNPANVQYNIIFEDNTNIAGCPDFATMSFDLTSFGGNSAEVFADATAIEARMDILNPVTGQNWAYNAGTCQLQVTSTTPPEDHPADVIVYNLLPVYTYAIQENGNTACPIDYAFAEFDLTAFGGGAEESFIDEAGLLAQMDILNPGGSGNYQFDAGSCSLTLSAVTPPPVLNTPIPLLNVYSFPVVDMGGNDACPLDYSTTTFDLTAFSGGAAEIFVGEIALLTRMDVLNPGQSGQLYAFDAAGCALNLVSDTPPSVTTGNIVADVVTPVTYSFDITHPLVDPVCPIDYNAMNFDFTAFGGGASEFMADEATLLARMQVLNDAGGNNYSLNGATCAVEVTSLVPPAVMAGEIVAVIAPVSYIFFLKDTAGQNVCPLDFAINTFDMSIFAGGGTAETFADQAALLARFETLNPGDGSPYVFDNTLCLVIMDSVLPPMVTSGDVIVKDTFDLNLLNDDDPGTIETTGAFRFIPFENKSPSEISIDFAGVLFGGVQTRRLLIKTGGINGTIIGQSDDISVDIGVAGVQTFPFSTLTALTAGITYHIVYTDENNVIQTGGFGGGMKRTSGVSDVNNEILENGVGAPTKIRVRIQGILD